MSQRAPIPLPFKWPHPELSVESALWDHQVLVPFQTSTSTHKALVIWGDCKQGAKYAAFWRVFLACQWIKSIIPQWKIMIWTPCMTLNPKYSCTSVVFHRLLHLLQRKPVCLFAWNPRSPGEGRRPLGAVPSAAALQARDAALCESDPGIHCQPDSPSVLERVHRQAGHRQRPGCHPPHARRLPQQSHLQVRPGTVEHNFHFMEDKRMLQPDLEAPVCFFQLFVFYLQNCKDAFIEWCQDVSWKCIYKQSLGFSQWLKMQS